MILAARVRGMALGRWWLMLAASALGSGHAFAQPAVRVVTPVVKQPSVDECSAVLHTSEEATTLLSRAQEGEQRHDYKLVVDSLQRIIELPGDHVLATNNITYESARLHAQRQLGRLPAEVRNAYRLIYDGEATSLYKQALQQHDEQALRRLVDRSLMTSVGDDAAVTLADWLCDEGRFLEAAVFLRLVRSTYPDSDLPAWVVPLRLAVCMAELNHRDEATQLLNEVSAQPGGQEAEVAARVEQVRQFIGRAPASRPEPATVCWPMANGRSSRDGYMPLVEPRFTSHLPWNVLLPVPQPRVGTAEMENYAARHELIPTAEVVTDGRVLVVKSGANMQALDLATFDPLWSTRGEEDEASLLDLESTVPAQPVWSPVSVQGGGPEPLDGDPQVLRLYYDSVGNQVCLAADMAMTVEWPGDPPNTLSARRERCARRSSMSIAGSGQTDPNFVAVYSLADGRRVWISDTASGPHALGPVQFLAVPMVVRGLLLAPCRVNDDFYVVLLDPQTGKVVQQVFLCGTGGAQFDSLYACTPAVADGVVFVPTGRGVLAAIDVASWSIRWAVRYDQAGAFVNQMTWLPSPAIAVRDVVLVAPPDADALLCFDRGTGGLRWQAPREGADYLLAANEQLAWVVGEDVQAIDLETGKQVWKTECGVSAGRAARSGDRLYVPTRAGMFVLDAASGKQIEREDEESAPPGNLLAFDGSLYVASAFEVRKYPDMKRGYEQALAAWSQNPGDASLAMRLAWLEQLKGQPARALEVLARVPEGFKTQDPQRYGRMLHLKMLAMLDLANAPETTAERARELLVQAQQIAPTQQDTITALLALADHLRRSDADGDHLQGCLTLAALVFDPVGDEMLREESGEYERRAMLVASRKLSDALAKLSSEQIAAFAATTNEMLAKAVAEHDVRMLRRVSNCSALVRLGVQADMVLSIWAARDLAYEQAEAHLQRVIRRAQSPDLLAEAVARLAVIYLQPDDLHMPVAAVDLLKRLNGEFGSVTLPLDIAEPEWALPGKTTGKTVTGSELARVLRKRIDNGILARHEAVLGAVALGSPGKAPIDKSYPNSRPVVLRGSRPETLVDRMLLLNDERTLEAHRVEDGELIWPAELRLLGEMSVESRNMVESNMRSNYRPGNTSPARGVSNGQTLILNTRFGIHAVGLLTGRRLWSRRFDPPTRSEQEASGSDAWLWASDGYVLSVDNFGRLEVARAETGNDVLWSRRILQRRWQTVRTLGDHVVVGDGRLQQVDVFQLSDGTYLGQCKFTQPVAQDDAVNIAVVGKVVCGPKSDREVVAFDLDTPGVERWNVQTTARLSQIFKPAADSIGIADRSGRVQLVEPDTGKVTLDVQVPGCKQGVIDGRIVSGVLYVYGLTRRAEANHAASEGHWWGMAAVRVSDGSVLWNHEDLGALPPTTSDVLDGSSNAIPLLVYRSSSLQTRLPQGSGPIVLTTSGLKGKLEFSLLEKTTGKTLGEKVTMDTELSQGMPALLDLECWPNSVTAFYGTTYVRFDLSASSGGTGAAGEHRTPAETGR